MKKKWLTAIIIYLVLLASCIVVVYAVPSVKGMLEKTYVAEFGKIDIADEVSAFIVRDETVYVAEQDSEVSRVAKEGSLVKATAHIVNVDPIAGSEEGISHKYSSVLEALGNDVVETDSGKTHDAGYVCYYVDGAEAKLSTDKITSLNQKSLKELTGYSHVETQENNCAKGEPLFKIVHNSRWFLVFYIDKKDAEKYSEGRTVYLETADGSVPVKVAYNEEGKKTSKIVLACKTFFDGFLDERRLDTKIIVASAEGLVLEDSSIVKKGEQIGVLVKDKLGEHKFKPISIKADNGEQCVVYSDIYVDADGNFVETVKTYDEIVAEPTEEEIADLQVQAKREAEEAAAAARKKAEEERIAAEKEAAEKAAAEKAAAERAAQQAQQTQQQPAAQQPADQAAQQQADQAGTASPDEQAVIDAQEAAGIQSDPAPEPIADGAETGQ